MSKIQRLKVFKDGVSWSTYWLIESYVFGVYLFILAVDLTI